jgi:hypothetical protein
VNIINNNFKKELDEKIDECRKKKGEAAAHALQSAWEKDCEERKQFYDDQLKNSKFIIWETDKNRPCMSNVTA